ncbi:MAG: DUF4097 family beta strand repeat-containing protein [Lachnospiraceae bacterium]|nr:DUF4097 family beta strand repeat-containing protein [Lachnospiraceae bacterium]
MRRMTKVLLMTALGCGIIGGAFGIVSLCSGFQADEFATALTDGRFQISGRPEWTDSVSSFVTDFTEDGVDFEEVYTGIDSLNLDIGVADCTIIPSDTQEWKVVGYDVPSRFKCRQRGKTLDIECKKGFWSFLNIVQQEPELEIWIPKSQLLKEVRIDVGVGDLNAVKGVLRCKQLEIDCGVGDCDIRADIEKRVEIDGGVGHVQLMLTGQEKDFDYDIDCGVGSVEIGGKKYSELGSETKIDNDADKTVKIDCGVGSVEVEFETEAEAGKTTEDKKSQAEEKTDNKSKGDF